jgi:hypothetical protein
VYAAAAADGQEPSSISMLRRSSSTCSRAMVGAWPNRVNMSTWT